MTKNCLLIGLALVMACVWGCTPSPSPVESGGALHVGNGAEPQDLDPHVVTGVPEHRLCSTLFEGLVDLDPRTLEPVPAVAESWFVSEDQMIYTFALRANAAWSNGEPLTARDFAYSWRRVLSPALASEYAYMLYCIRNARRFHEGKLSDFGQVGIEVVDDRTLRVALEAPTAHFLAMQIHPAWYPVHQATIECFGRMDERGTKWTQPGNLVGNGAFTLIRWDPNALIIVGRNKRYWNAENVHLSLVYFHPVEDTLTEERLFRSGQLDLTENVPMNKIDVYRRELPGLIRIDPYFGTYFYRLNTTRPPFDDVRVRRAFAMSLDRETLVGQVVRGGRRPAACFTPLNPDGYTCRASIPYDVEEARRLLAEAGYPNGAGLPPIELLYNTSENHKLVAEAAQQMWKQNLNVEVALLNQDWKVYLSSLTSLDYQIARSGWIGDFLDPISFLECFVTGGGNNRTGYASPAYDTLITEAGRTEDAAKRMELFQQAEAQFLQDAPIIPIYFYTRVYLISRQVGGLRSNLLGYISFKDLYLRSSSVRLSKASS